MAPYVNAFVDRHGHRRSYFRHGAINIALPPIGTLAFGEAYAEALAKHGPEAPKKGSAAHGTIAWVIEQYEKHKLYASRKPATQIVYGRVFAWLKERYGQGEFASIREEHVRRIGLRHRAGADLAEAGCSPREIMSILGHATERQAAEYVEQARRKVMAKSAMSKWERGPDGV
jgi:integrase